MQTSSLVCRTSWKKNCFEETESKFPPFTSCQPFKSHFVSSIVSSSGTGYFFLWTVVVTTSWAFDLKENYLPTESVRLWTSAVQGHPAGAVRTFISRRSSFASTEQYCTVEATRKSSHEFLGLGLFIC